jgi:hypothetical protein
MFSSNPEGDFTSTAKPSTNMDRILEVPKIIEVQDESTDANKSNKKLDQQYVNLPQMGINLPNYYFTEDDLDMKSSSSSD